MHDIPNDCNDGNISKFSMEYNVEFKKKNITILSSKDRSYPIGMAGYTVFHT